MFNHYTRAISVPLRFNVKERCYRYQQLLSSLRIYDITFTKCEPFQRQLDFIVKTVCA